ncbi:MAG TPA: L-seryl-tRNA(Sec) selenium transferase [Acidimicrobiales bacterium]|nr:L-seryl-tRNA(Sec) selenium transferase [Acidimicrobiales bacterium]
MPHPPSVDSLARSIADVGLPHPLLVDAARAANAAGDPERARGFAEDTRAALLQPVINATGVLLHTNLGRAPLEVHQTADYVNIELDLTTGKRGSRRERAGALLARACGAEAALVVNNGAAAMLLALAALARGQGVAVSRGELVEIGGGFRVPEVMAESGARLVEVGTTNRTRRDDYARVADDVTMLLKVHQSNYRITGFTEEASVADVASIGPPVLVDLGSGLLDAACPWLADGPPPWLRDEPAVRQTLAAGAALVAFSGDKLLGGPQAGILAGRLDAVDACARHPLYRALRPGTLVLGALEQVALAYLQRDGAHVPFWRMATASLNELRSRAEAIGVGKVVDCASVTGGGTLPGIEIPSVGIALDGDVTERLRAAQPKPVIARVDEQHTLLDLRTVNPDDDELVRASVSRI